MRHVAGATMFGAGFVDGMDVRGGESRVFIWQRTLPLIPVEALATMPAVHPMWGDADPDLIALVDKQAAHGNFRARARITEHAADGLAISAAPCDGSALRP